MKTYIATLYSGSALMLFSFTIVCVCLGTCIAIMYNSTRGLFHPFRFIDNISAVSNMQTEAMGKEPMKALISTS